MSAATPPTPPAASAPTAGVPVAEESHDEVCPLCGAPLRDDQDWCVRCGAAARTRLASPPNWRLPAAALALLVIICLGGLTAALVKLAGGSGTTTITTPLPVAAPVTPPATGATGATGTTGASAAPAPATPSGSTGALGAAGPSLPPTPGAPPSVPGTGGTAARAP